MEFFDQFLLQGLHHLRLGVTDPVNSLTTHEVANALIDFLGQQLFEPVWTKVVKEFASILLKLLMELRRVLWKHVTAFVGLPTDVQVDADIDGDEDVVLGRHALDRAVESNGVAGNHHHDLAEPTVAAFAARLHQTGILPANLFERHHTSRQVQPA